MTNQLINTIQRERKDNKGRDLMWFPDINYRKWIDPTPRMRDMTWEVALALGYYFEVLSSSLLDTKTYQVAELQNHKGIAVWIMEEIT